MKFRRLLGSFVAVFFLAAPASADLPIVWKFAKGQTFEFERVASQKISVELKGEKLNQEQASTWLIRFEVKEKRGDNHAVQATLAKVEHKSSGADALDPKLATKMQGSTFILDVTPSGRIAIMQGYGDFVKRASDNDPARRKALQATLPEAALREAFADVFGPLPTGTDKTWEREVTESIPHFGLLKHAIRYNYNGESKGSHLVSYKATTSYAPPKGETAILRVSKGRLDDPLFMGVIAFDKDAGRLVQHGRTILLGGTLAIEFMDRKDEAAFTLESRVKISVKK